MPNVRFADLAPELLSPVTEACADLGITVASDADITVHIAAGDALRAERRGNDVYLSYTASHLCECFRALSHLSRLLRGGETVTESARYRTLCYMADCSRNAVMNVETAKRTIRTLALMGYDAMMLYTEDTYELPGYPYFGRMRGGYTAEELRKLDDYAASFGIELIPCIQTLAHLATSLRYAAFRDYIDINDILLVGEDKVYELIDAMLNQCAKCFRTRRIHIGMDEAWALGRGNYQNKNGPRPSSEIMLEHLSRVVALCREKGFSPMMWGDMFFYMAFGGTYVDEGEIAPEIMEKVPEGLSLVYWDYYSRTNERVAHMLDAFLKFNRPVVFAGGAWKWTGFASRNDFSLVSTRLQLDECERVGVTDIIATGWGDDGAEASQFSHMASLLYYAERDYGKADDVLPDARAHDVFGTSFETLLAFDLPDALPGATPDTAGFVHNPSKYLLYNDPLERFFDCHMKDGVDEEYRVRAEKLLSLTDEPFGYAFRTLGLLCRVLSRKATLGKRIYEAYRDGKRDVLRAVAEEEIPVILSDLRALIDAFREQWYKENKTFGFTAQEIRLGGLCERLSSVRLRLLSYLDGKIPAIEELTFPPIPYIPSEDGEYLYMNEWRNSVNTGII